MIAFVFSGGASLGAVQVGMLKALYEQRVAPDLIIGTSTGAFNGAYIASRPQTPATADGLAEIWKGIGRFRVFPPNPIVALLGLLGRRDHLFPNTGLRRLIGEHLEFERMEQAPITFQVIASDVRNGREHELCEGDAAQAILAAASFPGVFPLVEFDGGLLVDGAIADNTPIDDAIERGADTVYVLPTGFGCGLDRKPSGALPVLLQSMTLLINKRLVRDIERLSAEAELIVLPPPCPLSIDATDFSQSHRLIDSSYEVASEALADNDPAANWTPRAVQRLRPHRH